MNVTNLESDPEYAAVGSGATLLRTPNEVPQWGPGVKTLEGNAYNSLKWSKNLYFDTFFHVAN